MQDRILLGHGSGGKLSSELIHKIFVKKFKNDWLDRQTDAALLNIEAGLLSFTTDSFVVDPIFFPGGDIGKIAIAGTVNDLAVSGAIPLFLSCSVIIEEGLLISDLERIVDSMAEEASKAGVKIVTGDTKVVDKGKCDKIFINTSGIGKLQKELESISTGENISISDKIIINGSIADHGMAVLSARNEMNLSAEINSDCASLNHLIKSVLEEGCQIKFMRDATRGGLATVISELADRVKMGINLYENKIPVHENVRGICEILGFDPLYVANEGKVVMVVSDKDAEKTIDILKHNPLGKDSAIIGEITTDYKGKAWLTTEIGGKRIIDTLAGEQLPRIC